MKKRQKIMGLTRIFLGWIMFWAFVDKLFGLGFATEAGKSWLDGTSPTTGFLKFGTKGPFAGMFQMMAGNPVIDWLFMLGLLLIGVALILGIGVRIAGYSGAILMVLMYIAVLPGEHNPVVDEHIIYALLFKFFAHSESGQWLGLGKWWASLPLVKRHPILI